MHVSLSGSLPLLPLNNLLSEVFIEGGEEGLMGVSQFLGVFMNLQGQEVCSYVRPWPSFFTGCLSRLGAMGLRLD